MTGVGMETNAAGMEWGQGGESTNFWMWGEDGDKMMSPCHSLVH